MIIEESRKQYCEKLKLFEVDSCWYCEEILVYLSEMFSEKLEKMYEEILEKLWKNIENTLHKLKKKIYYNFLKFSKQFWEKLTKICKETSNNFRPKF